MILQRLRRLVGAAILVLAPSLGLAQSALQQPNLVASAGAPVDTIPAAFTKLYQNDLFLQNLVAGRFNTLGAAALLNVGTVAGTVADGGALTAETARALAAEQVITATTSANATAIASETSRAQVAEALKAPIASPAFTGIPTGPTAGAGTSTTQLATTAFVANAVAAGGGGGSGGVPTSRQILTSGLATGGGDLTADRTVGVPAAAQSDVAAGTDQTKALTAYSIAAALGAKAPLASPALVGVPTAPTASAGTTGTQIATVGYVGSAINPAVASPSTNLVLTGADAERPLYPSGTPTITAANGGVGWRSGPITNFNSLSGLVTLAVPSGAALDGTTNGTTVLRPKQRARIIQIGATAYVTDWIDRTPIVSSASITTSTAFSILQMPVGYSAFEIVISGVTVDTSGASLGLRVSSDGGSSFKTGASDYYVVLTASNSSGPSVQAAAGALSYIEVAATVATTGYMPVSAKGTIYPGSASFGPSAIIDAAHINTVPASVIRQTNGRYTAAALVANAIVLITTSGNMTGGTVTLKGVP